MMKLEREMCMEQFAAVKRSKDGQPVRYLIVDDSVFARKNLARMIETFGGQVAAEAGDGLTAISEFERTHPDIVLMDITMPQMEGIEAAEKIVQAHPEARVVMVSSVGYQENIVAALQRGARHFVQKPVKPVALYEGMPHVMGEDGTAAQAGARRVGAVPGLYYVLGKPHHVSGSLSPRRRGRAYVSDRGHPITYCHRFP